MEPAQAAAEGSKPPKRALPVSAGSSQRPAKRQKPSGASQDASTSTAPPKRPHHAGKLRKLGVLASSLPKKSLQSKVQGKSTVTGARVGGKAKDLEMRGGGTEEMWVSRSKGKGKGGMPFAAYLKKGVSAFSERGAHKLLIHGLGAAIPLALTLGLAIRDAVPGGKDAVTLKTATSSVEVGDEIEPDDVEEDVVYQTRTKSAVTLTLMASAMRKPAVAAGASRKAGNGGRDAGAGRQSNSAGRQSSGAGAPGGGNFTKQKGPRNRPVAS